MIINSDGSEPEMCGNGVRCFQFLYDQKMLNKPVFSLETKAGTMLPAIKKDGDFSAVEVDMGATK